MRPALLALTLLLAFSLAGCSKAPSQPVAGTPAASFAATSTAPAAPVPTTDTLHFLAAPAMGTAITGAEAATPVTVGNFGQNNGQGGAQWSYAIRVHTNITNAEVHVWVMVKETMFDNPGTPAQPQCTWRLTTVIGADTQPVRSCINEPPGPINAGTKELVFSIVLESNLELEAGETVLVRLERSAFSLSPNNAADALSNSSEHDSRIVLKGLVEPTK